MYFSKPVLIPKAPGKITLTKRGETSYVLFETGRRYDPNRKYNVPERVGIGVQIPGKPELMLPNENYRTYVKEGEAPMNEEQKKTATIYAADKKQFIMLRELFDQMYYEFQLQSRRKPDDPVNPYKASKINSILEPLRKLMEGEDYAVYLDLIDVQEGETGSEHTVNSNGKTYSDVALMLTQYKGAMKRFSNEKM